VRFSKLRITGYVSAIVGGTEGPFQENVEKRFEQIEKR